jgi:hypothetical protein
MMTVDEMQEFIDWKKKKDATTDPTKLEFVQDESTNRVVFPKGWTLTAIGELAYKEHEAMNQQIVPMRVLKGWHMDDSLYSVKKTCEVFFGNFLPISDEYGNPPISYNITIDVINSKKILTEAHYGWVDIPNWTYLDGRGRTKSSHLEVDINDTGEVIVSIRTIKKWESEATRFLSAIENMLLEQSIFRNKAIEVTNKLDSKGNKTGKLSFELFELTLNPNIVLNKEQELTVERDILYDLTKDEKNSYVFYGKYGNAKSETSNRVAVKAIELGYTFFVVKDAEVFTTLLSTSVNYGKPLVFIEDIDEITSVSRDEVNGILNVMDSIKDKNTTVKIIFTTNNQDRIEPAMRRPGRMGIMLGFDNPTFETVINIFNKILNINPRNPIAPIIDWNAIKEIWPDCSGAFTALIAKRVRNWVEQEYTLNEQLIIEAIDVTRSHIEYSNRPQVVESSIENAIKLINSCK